MLEVILESRRKPGDWHIRNRMTDANYLYRANKISLDELVGEVDRWIVRWQAVEPDTEYKIGVYDDDGAERSVYTNRPTERERNRADQFAGRVAGGSEGSVLGDQKYRSERRPFGEAFTSGGFSHGGSGRASASGLIPANGTRRATSKNSRARRR